MEMICIQCPMGCHMQVEEQDGKLAVSGYTCRRGLEYAKNEYTHPVRTITTTLPTDGTPAWLPVRTRQPIPKSRMDAALAQLAKLKVKAPLKVGDCILEDVAGTGINVIAACPLKERY